MGFLNNLFGGVKKDQAGTQIGGRREIDIDNSVRYTDSFNTDTKINYIINSPNASVSQPSKKTITTEETRQDIEDRPLNFAPLSVGSSSGSAEQEGILDKFGGILIIGGLAVGGVLLISSFKK